MPSEDIKPSISLIKTEENKQNDNESEDKRITPPIKSSMEILSELFECFDAEPPLIIKKEKDEHSKKKKKSKKKHKHKDKKHKKKDKKRKRSSSSSSSSSSNESAVDLGEILIKKEEDATHKKIKIEGLDKSIEIKNEESPPAIEEGEIVSSLENDKKIKKEKTRERTRYKSRERTREKSHRQKEKIKRSRSRDNDFYKPRENDFYKSSRDRSRERIDLRSRIDDFHKTRERSKERKPSRNSSKREHRSRSSDGRKSKLEEDFYKSSRERYNKERENKYKERIDYIDKKKLLEIARKNAIQMMKSGNLPGALTLGPQAQEKVIAAIRAGGKTIEELTDFCKTLSKQEALGELSSGPEDNGSDSETAAFHHPFQIKARPTSITMNIKNSVPLPIKTTQEKNTELRMQFPVSSGQLHRKTESDWVPVSPKQTESASELLAIEAPPPPPVPVEPTIITPNPEPPSIDIGSIVSQRLTAIRKLQENPNDVQALTEMYKSNKEMQSWAQSKQQPGQFTGTTGANILSQAELSSGYQAWARKDQLQSATPVSGGMGMHLLQKMGWKPGEGLGKEKTGTLEPLLLEVKLDKKGLVANEEQKRKKKQQAQWANKALQSKHPVSLLGEYASKKKLGAPEYTLCFECGPDHKKNFLFKVILNGVEYKPNIASPNKKEAKAAAASVCLQQLGLLPIVS